MSAGASFFGRSPNADQSQRVRRGLEREEPRDALPRILEPARVRRERLASRCLQLVRPPTARDGQPAIAHARFHAASRHGPHVDCVRQFEALLHRRVDHRACEGMLAAALHRRGEAQDLGARARGRQDLGHARLAFRQRAGLVEGHDAGAVRGLERLRVLDQDAVARRDPGTDHDRRGRGEPERTGTGDHEHGHRVEDGHFPIAAEESPGEQRHAGRRDDRGHEHLAHAVDQALDRRLGRLGRLDLADDARERALRAHGDRARDEATFAVHRAAGHAARRRPWPPAGSRR